MRLTQSLNRRKCVIRWAPWLILVLLLFFFQADLLARSKDYSSTRLSRALEVFGGKWETSPSGSSTENENDTDSEFDCEKWLEKHDRIKYSRDFSAHPITVGYGETANWDTCAIGCKFQGSAAIDGEHKADAIFGLTNDPSIESIIRSMESAQYYPDNDINNAKGKGFSVVMTTSLESDVPVGYFSWAEYDIMAPPKNKTADALAAAFISNCGGHNFRLEAITKLRENGVTVDSYGACLRNKDGHVNKLETLRDYKFSLAFENSNEDDYITEKFWQSLVAGSVPVVIGAPNIYDFAPSNNSILYIKRVEDISSVAKQIKKLASDDDAYNAKLSWKYEGPSDSFKALVDMAVVHSSCRLCLHIGTKIRMKEENKAKRPCQCKRNSLYTTYHIFVRERGKFEMESIYLRSNNLTLAALHDAILSKFTAMKYVPVFKSGRPKIILGDDTLKLYTVYPVGLTQRQALYKWRFRSDEDLQKYIKEHPCANLEVIFV